MGKTRLGNNVFDFPMPVTLLGTLIDGKPNFMALGWVSRANANPPMTVIGVGKSHHTNRGIRENGAFSINYPDAGMREAADYCGIVSGEREDKSGIFEVFYGELPSAPMIARCSLCLECRLVQTVELQTNTLYIAEIAAAYAEEGCLTDGKPDIRKMNPLLLTMPDNRYWTVGECVGRAWSDGKRYREGREAR